MPTLEELDTLKNRINELGDEPRLLAERGETIRDVAPPEPPEGMDQELEQLLSDDGGSGGIDEMEALLGSYADDLGDISAAEESSDEIFDLDDLQAPSDAMLSATDSDLPGADGVFPGEEASGNAAPAGGGEPAGEPVPGEPEETGEPVPGIPGEPGAAGIEDLDFTTDLEDLIASDDFGVESSDGAGAETPVGEELPADDFALEDLEDLADLDDLIGAGEVRTGPAGEAIPVDAIPAGASGSPAEPESFVSEEEQAVPGLNGIAPGGEAAAGDDFNLDDLISDMPADAPLDEAGAAGADDASLGAGEPQAALTEEDEFGVGIDDLEELGELGDIEGFGEPEDFGGIEDMEIPGGETADEAPEPAESAEPGAETPEGETPDEDFSFDDLDFGDAVEADIPGETAGEAVQPIPGDETDDTLPDEAMPLAGPGPESPAYDKEPGIAEPEEFAGLEELGDLEDLSIAEEIPGEEAGGPEDSDLGLPDDLSLDDLNFGDDAGLELEETGSGDEITGDEDGLEDLGGLDDLGGPDETGAPEIEGGLDIPDVAAAVEGLGDLDNLTAGSDDELSLDEELNFEEELGADVLSDIREAGDESNQFSMDDFGEAYNFKEGESGFADNLGVDLEQLEQSLDEAAEDEAKPFSLGEEDYREIIQTLASLPKNLKAAIEELLADERRNIEDLQPLINALIDGETPKALAARFRAITKRKIELPRSYEKRSGRELETRRASLVYRLGREGWPVIRTILLVTAVAWGVGAAVFMWVYRPLKADSLYRAGLDAIAVDDVDEAVVNFYDAWDGWPLFVSPDGDRIADAHVVVKGWKVKDRWLDYARSLRRRKHWDAADRFYAGYMTVSPGDKEARLEYSAFLAEVMGKYERAVALLDEASTTTRGNPDRDYMLAAGDVYLHWAEDDPTRYEEARYRYAKVLETSRNDERAILSMMRYHLRIGDEEEIRTLLPIFDNEVPGRTEEPELAAEVFADLGDFHLVRGDEMEARRFIDLALAADPGAPEPSYVNSRYWRSRGDAARELRAHKRTLVNLDGRESLSRRDLEMRILTMGGLGRLYSRQVSSLTDPVEAAQARSLATGNYAKALELYEDARARNQLGAAPEYGRLYLELGDVFYEGAAGAPDLTFTLAGIGESMVPGADRYSELSQAVDYYDEAEKLFDRGGGGTRLPARELYRRGYARYVLGLDGALVDFHRTARLRPDDYEVRLALATALLAGGDTEASRSQYARTLELLDRELDETGGVLNPLDRQGHEELLLRYVAAWNNLGVGRARSAARGGGEDEYGAALSAFTMASEYLDEVYTDMDGLISRGAVGMRDLEERRVVIDSEEDGRTILKEKTTYPYRNRLRLLGLESAEVGEDAFLIYPDIPSDLISDR